jgi:hypothetical protein
MLKTYRYFVSYIAFLEKGRLYGYCETESNIPFDRLDAIKATAEMIREKDGFKSVTILYFKLLGFEFNWKELFRKIRRLIYE